MKIRVFKHEEHYCYDLRPGRVVDVDSITGGYLVDERRAIDVVSKRIGRDPKNKKVADYVSRAEQSIKKRIHTSRKFLESHGFLVLDSE